MQEPEFNPIGRMMDNETVDRGLDIIENYDLVKGRDNIGKDGNLISTRSRPNVSDEGGPRLENRVNRVKV